MEVAAEILAELIAELKAWAEIRQPEELKTEELKVFNSLRLSMVDTTEAAVEVLTDVLPEVLTDVLVELISGTELV